MASENAERFMNALHELEQTGNLDPLVEQFTQDAELRRLTGEEPARGPEGTRKFWKEYLAALGQIRTEFKHIVEGGDTIVLEWVTEVDPDTGRPFTYEGVSILEMENGQVRRFRTYYDTAKFIQTDTGSNQR
jgi:ketosteroid isomerase-like protein